MASSYVRSMIRGWGQSAATAVGVPFYETVNTEQDPQDDVWWSLEFFAEISEKLSFCDVWREEGLCEIVVFGRAGFGDAVVISAAEAIRDEILKNSDPARKLYLTGLNAPSEDSGGSGGQRWYQVSISIDYRYTN